MRSRPSEKAFWQRVIAPRPFGCREWPRSNAANRRRRPEYGACSLGRGEMALGASCGP